jgi:translation initiation factor 3 subunit D
MDFAAQLNVSLANGWGIVRTVADLCLKMPEGKYVLVKDPNKVCIPRRHLAISVAVVPHT